MRRETILDEAKRLVYGDREKDYDHPLNDATRFTCMLNAVYQRQMNAPFTPKDYAIIMLLVKINREMHRHKRDNAVDIAGYASVLARCQGDDE